MGGTASRPRQIREDAAITIPELASPYVEVTFTQIQGVDTGDLRADMSWNGIPLVDGRFSTGSVGNLIEGTIYVRNHEKVRGVFERNLVVGTFSAIHP